MYIVYDNVRICVCMFSLIVCVSVCINLHALLYACMYVCIGKQGQVGGRTDRETEGRKDRQSDQFTSQDFRAGGRCLGPPTAQQVTGYGRECESVGGERGRKGEDERERRKKR